MQTQVHDFPRQGKKNEREKNGKCLTLQKASLAKNESVWSLITVLKTLEKMASVSKIRELLQSENGDQKLQSEQNDLKALGYFSLVGQLRVHCMLGDYYCALRSIDHIKMLAGNDEELFCSTVTPCHITLYYYTGFCYMMLHRYSDASGKRDTEFVESQFLFFFPILFFSKIAFHLFCCFFREQSKQ